MSAGKAAGPTGRQLVWFVVGGFFALQGVLLAVAMVWSVAVHHAWGLLPGEIVWGLLCYWIAVGAWRRAARPLTTGP